MPLLCFDQLVLIPSQNGGKEEDHVYAVYAGCGRSRLTLQLQLTA
jgi:hypothetical protein